MNDFYCLVNLSATQDHKIPFGQEHFSTNHKITSVVKMYAQPMYRLKAPGRDDLVF